MAYDLTTAAGIHAYLESQNALANYGNSAGSTQIAVVPTQVISAVSNVSYEDAAKQARIEEYKRNVGWDNLPAARALQEDSWWMYIETGRWDNPRQLENNKQAEEIRRYENPMYTGRPGTGPTSYYDAAKISPPTDQYQSANGLESLIDKVTSPEGASNVMGIGILAVMAMVVMSFLGRR